MPDARKTVLVLDPLPEDVEAELASRFTVLRAYADGLDVLIDGHGPEIAALTSRGKTDIDQPLLGQLGALELIAAYGVGYDRIDASAAARRGIVVTNTPDVLNADVADLAVSLLLATVRRIPQAEAFLRSGAWESGAFPLTSTLRERTVGLVGMGRIGQEIARRLAAFDVKIAYHSRNRVPDLPYPHFPDLAEMARLVDTMVVIVPGGASTHHLIDADILSALGKDGIFVNVSRGSVVDQEALIQALADHTILAAGLDVYDGEPVVPEALRTLDNVVLLPHIGSGTHHTRAAMGRLFLDNVTTWFAEGRPVTPVKECAALVSWN